jgi:hypothetical protein
MHALFIKMLRMATTRDVTEWETEKENDRKTRDIFFSKGWNLQCFSTPRNLKNEKIGSSAHQQNTLRAAG